MIIPVYKIYAISNVSGLKEYALIIKRIIT